MYASYNNYSGGDNTAADENIPRISYDIVKRDDFARALRNHEVVVVKAWARWCLPCVKTAVQYEKLATRLMKYIMSDRLIFLKDEIDSEESIHKEDVTVVPTYFVYVDGRIDRTFSGVDYREFEEYLLDRLKQKN